MTLFLISGILALIPLLGVAGIAAFGSPTTVDGLFLSLILLAIAAPLLVNAFFEFRKWRSGFYAHVGRAAHAAAATVAGLIQRGKVVSVDFFESNVGQPNKSIVMLADGERPPQTIVLEGDMRNALPTGRKVEFTVRKMPGYNVLVDVSYS